MFTKSSGKYSVVPTSMLIADEDQPRKLFDPVKLKQLKESVGRYGIKSPIIVEKVGDKYLIEDGERRFRVAKELGLKEVPVIIEETKTGIERLVQQFHIQEQHEEWTPTEKAVTVVKLASELGVSLRQICELLGLDERTARQYVSFANILDKKNFHKNEIGVYWAEAIAALKAQIKRIYSDEDIIFDKNVEREIENATISRIVSGDISRTGDVTKLKDSFTTDPKTIKKFLETKDTIDSIFVISRAKSAFYIRNIANSCGYILSASTRFAEQPNAKVSPKQLNTIRVAVDRLQIILNKFGE